MRVRRRSVDDLQPPPLVVGRGGEQGADGVGHAAVASDHAPHVVGRHLQLDDALAATAPFGDLDGLGIVSQIAADGGDKLMMLVIILLLILLGEVISFFTRKAVI